MLTSVYHFSPFIGVEVARNETVKEMFHGRNIFMSPGSVLLALLDVLMV
jgi:hypothetical protein